MQLQASPDCIDEYLCLLLSLADCKWICISFSVLSRTVSPNVCGKRLGHCQQTVRQPTFRAGIWIFSDVGLQQVVAELSHFALSGASAINSSVKASSTSFAGWMPNESKCQVQPTTCFNLTVLCTRRREQRRRFYGAMAVPVEIGSPGFRFLMGTVRGAHTKIRWFLANIKKQTTTTKENSQSQNLAAK